MSDGKSKGKALRIEDYALVGDTHSAALVGRNGSIDWLCWPRFDSGACFAALLGTPEQGCWRIAPEDQAARATRMYRDGTLVLETLFRTPDGAEAMLTDCMPLDTDGSPRLVRVLEGRQGAVPMLLDLAIRFDYGRSVPWVTRLSEGHGICGIAGPDMVVLRTPVPLQGEGLRSCARFILQAGERLVFELAYAPSHLPPPAPLRDPLASIEETAAHWRSWSERVRGAGHWTAAVRRSALTLKALTYRPTGAIVAAPTTSLPEEIGGSRNWDYRFCWLRDATLTLLALLHAGHQGDARAWRDWLLRAAMGSPEQIQILYGIGGERRIPEFQADWLSGYGDSRPVRIGNAAHEQLQLDVFGEMMDALHQAHRRGLAMSPADWALQRALVRHLETVWQKPDQGIWEMRGDPQHFTYSKVMAWAAFDRAVRGIEAFGLEGPLERWRALRHQIHDEVCREGFDEKRNSFVQAYGSQALDASLLLLPAIGFLPPEDPRIHGTIAAVEEELMENGLLLRYRPDRAADGQHGAEGAFLACSFWLVDAWGMTGRHEEATALFERLLALRNDVGLLSEEYDPHGRRMLGNFPQAFTHVALLNSAYGLHARRGDGQDAPRLGAEAGADPDAGRD